MRDQSAAEVASRPHGGRILFDVDDRVGFITFNRPEALNAIDIEMARAMGALVPEIRARDDIDAFVLRGAGPAFMAGGDIKFFQGPAEQTTPLVAEVIDNFHAFTLALQGAPQPVIGSVHGAAAGGGFSLAIGTDLTIAAASATFAPAYLRLGTSPDGGGTFFLARLLGPKRALEMFLAGKPCPAAEAARLGLVNRVVPDPALDSETRALANGVTHGARPAIFHTKKLLQRDDLAALTRQLAAEREMFLACMRTPDFAEGVAAFLEKRAPRFARPLSNDGMSG